MSVHLEIKRDPENIREVASDRDLGKDGEFSKNNGSFLAELESPTRGISCNLKRSLSWNHVTLNYYTQ